MKYVCLLLALLIGAFVLGQAAPRPRFWHMNDCTRNNEDVVLWIGTE